jgi:hypothetical protein
MRAACCERRGVTLVLSGTKKMTLLKPASRCCLLLETGYSFVLPLTYRRM